MTAEVAILTRSAVALAADSAVTVGKDRVWKNTNKLFSVSAYNDIAIMIYGTGDFCGISWEVVIKQFRSQIGRRVFKSVEEAAQSFEEFLSKFETPSSQIENLNLYSVFLDSITDCCTYLEQDGALRRRRLYSRRLDELITSAEEMPIVFDHVSREQFSRKFSKVIKRFLDTETKIHVTKSIHSRMITLCYERARRQYSSMFQTRLIPLAPV